MAVGQHAVHAGESIPLPTWTRPQAGKSISVQKWNSPHGRAGKSTLQMLLLGHQMTVGCLQLSSFVTVVRGHVSCQLINKC